MDLGTDDLANRIAVVFLRPDAIALEEDETLQLILRPLSNFIRMNEFVDDTINITIIDDDGES